MNMLRSDAIVTPIKLKRGKVTKKLLEKMKMCGAND